MFLAGDWPAWRRERIDTPARFAKNHHLLSVKPSSKGKECRERGNRRLLRRERERERGSSINRRPRVEGQRSGASCVGRI